MKKQTILSDFFDSLFDAVVDNCIRHKVTIKNGENKMDQRITEKEKEEILERFMKENFHYPSLLKAGFFTKEMKNDYKAQAERICHFFGYKNVYEYGAEELRCHISYVEGKSPEYDGFITVIPSLYE